MKNFLAIIRFPAIILLLTASSLHAQQPGTPASAAPPPIITPQPPPPSETPSAQQPLQNQNNVPPPSTSLYAPWSIELFYWLTSTTPYLRGGAAAFDYENLNYPGHGNYTPGVSLSIPVSRSAMLNISGFIAKGSSSTTASRALDLFTTTYSAGDFLTSNYNVKNVKASFQDLLFPFPRRDNQKFRIKTLWEVQYDTVNTNIFAPFVPTTDSLGNAVITSSTGSRDVIYPTFGLAVELHPTRNLELDAYGSGFGIPHHAAIADAEGSIGYHLGAVELLVADRYYYLKTSVQSTEYFRVTLTGPYAAVRFYPSEISIPCFFCRHKTVAAAEPASSTGAAGTSSANAPSATSSTTPPSEAAVSTSQNPNTSSSATHIGNYVRRFSAGATLSVLGLSLVPGHTNTVNNSSEVSTMYQTAGASSRIGYGVTAQVALTDRLAFDVQGLLRRIGYQLTTTVTTTTPAVLSGIVTTVTTSTINHEDTRANLIDVPAMVRFYSRGRQEPGTRWFIEGGGAWRRVEQIRTSMDFRNAQSVLSCCTTTPIAPAHPNAYGVVAGAGFQAMDAFGIRVVPEVRYTRWFEPTFHEFTTTTQQNEVAAGFSITF